MIVVRDHDFTADQHMIADGDGAGTGDVTPAADPNMIADDESGIEFFAAALSNSFEPKALGSGEVFPHRDRGKPAQIGTGADTESDHSQLAGQHAVAH